MGARNKITTLTQLKSLMITQFERTELKFIKIKTNPHREMTIT